MSIETVLAILLIVILTFGFGFVLDRWDRVECTPWGGQVGDLRIG
jgi:hypothetical protein